VPVGRGGSGRALSPAEHALVRGAGRTAASSTPWHAPPRTTLHDLPVVDPPWPEAERLTSDRLQLEPLRRDHVDEAFVLLDDVRLHTFTGGAPDTREQLVARFARQVLGSSPDGRHGWLNWVLRHRRGGPLLGTVQATLTRVEDQTAGDAETTQAELAWVVGHDHHGRGYATEAAAAVVAWLAVRGVRRFSAHIHPDHHASAGVARRLGLQPTDRVVDGELLWTR
jgi:RimJ/RimL family protein N-acetyltransferase